MRIVCLCGSTRHRDAFLAAQAAESLQGRIVLLPGVFSETDRQALTTHDVERLHALHRRKIEMADELLVVSPDGQVGETTAAEVEYATSLGKQIRYWDNTGAADLIDPVDALDACHRAQRLVANETPTLDVPADVKLLRCELIEEEAREFREALERDDLVEVADAIGDLLYVVYGAATTFGIPARGVFAEVHRSNMTKLDDDGHPIVRHDGKITKGPNYSPPDLLPVLRAAGFAG